MDAERIHESLWVKEMSSQSYPKQTSHVAVDVAIIGGGITGLTAAMILKCAGKTVALIEAKTVADSGTTAFCSAHLTEHLDTNYSDLIRRFGKESVQIVARSNRRAISFIKASVEKHAIECGFERVLGYLFTEDENDVDALREEYEAARSVGSDVILTTDVPLPFVAKAGVCFEHQAQFNPVQYLRGIAPHIAGEGSFIFENTRVLGIEPGDICQVKTEHGIISAASVVLATHTPAEFSFLQLELTAYRTYLIAARLMSNEPFTNALFWDMETPYHYIRQIKDAKGTLLIIGGEDHKTGQEQDTESCLKRLEEYARHHFSVGEIEYDWSAQYYDSLDGLPYIGRLSGSPNIFVGTGYSGNGLTFGTAAAQLISDLILGNPNESADLYSPKRISLSAVGQLISTGLGVAAQFIGDRLQAPEATATTEIERNEGKLMVIDGERLAVYKDEAGKIHQMSATCTHAGCIVHWNTTEKSWDCPCHGGRFNAIGDVLNGPPTEGLAMRNLTSKSTIKLKTSAE